MIGSVMIVLGMILAAWGTWMGTQNTRSRIAPSLAISGALWFALGVLFRLLGL